MERENMKFIFTNYSKNHKPLRGRFSLRFVRFSAVFFLLSAFCSLTSLSYGAKIHTAAGTTSATFLKIGVGARAASMAGAFTAVSDDPYAIYWNPAGIISLKGTKNLAFSHNSYFQGIEHVFMAYTLDAEKMFYLKNTALKKGVLGFGFNYLHIPSDIERRSGLNESDPLNPLSLPEGSFGAYDAAFSLTYAFSYEKSWDFGTSLKFIKQSIDNKSAIGTALDLGAMRDFNFAGKKLKAGFSILNIGRGMRFVSKRYDLPLTFRSGLSYKISKESGISFDIEKPVDNYLFFKGAIEQKISDRLILRAGYKYRMHGNELGAISGLGSGFGIVLKNLNFDYAFAPYGDLGSSHILSLSFRFGVPRKERPIVVKRLIMASDQLKNSQVFLYEVRSKLLKISSVGILYDVSAETESYDINKISFKTTLRGSSAVNVLINEGELPDKLLKKFPSDIRILKTFQFSSKVGNVHGKIKFNFKIPKENTEKIYFLRLNNGQWEKTDLIKTGEDEGSFHYEALSFFGTYFSIGAK